MRWVFKVVTRQTFDDWPADGPWSGNDKDRADGFIHLSAGAQVAGTLDKHYPGVDGLCLLWLAEDDLPPDDLRWEVSRGGAPFPHLYAPLHRHWVKRVDPLPIVDGRHRLPPDLPASSSSTTP